MALCSFCGGEIRCLLGDSFCVYSGTPPTNYALKLLDSGGHLQRFLTGSPPKSSVNIALLLVAGHSVLCRPCYIARFLPTSTFARYSYGVDVL